MVMVMITMEGIYDRQQRCPDNISDISDISNISDKHCLLIYSPAGRWQFWRQRQCYLNQCSAMAQFRIKLVVRWWRRPSTMMLKMTRIWGESSLPGQCMRIWGYVDLGIWGWLWYEERVACQVSMVMRGLASAQSTSINISWPNLIISKSQCFSQKLS